MMITIAISFAALAGFLNGSYTLPVKYMSHWQTENIWLVFAIFSFVLTPWIIMYSFDSGLLTLLTLINHKLLLILIIGGMLFGIGMVLFAFTLRYVGIGIAFLINIATGTVTASLLPLLMVDSSKILSSFGLLQLAAIGFFCLAIVASALVLKFRNQRLPNESARQNRTGFVIGFLSGVFAGAQGFTYAYSIIPIRETLLNSTSPIVFNNIPWLIIFTAAFIPYGLYFLLRSIRNASLKLFFKRETVIYYFYWFVTSLFYFLALILFSQSSMMLGDLGAIIAWPIFMSFIILTSNFWGYIHGEWKSATRKEISAGLINVVFLLIAIGLLALNAKLNLS